MASRALDAQHVEDHQRYGDRVAAVQDAQPEQGEARPPVEAERDQLAVEDEAVGRRASSGSRSAIGQPRRLRTCSPFSVDTIARKPSHFSS